MINTLIKYYKRRRIGKAWQEAIQAKQKKEQALQATTSLVATVQTTKEVPVHPPHVVFDRNYVRKDQAPELAELAKTAEAIRHLQFHDHGHQFAY